MIAILVRRLGNGFFKIVDGHARFRAMTLDPVPCNILNEGPSLIPRSKIIGS